MGITKSSLLAVWVAAGIAGLPFVGSALATPPTDAQLVEMVKTLNPNWGDCSDIDGYAAICKDGLGGLAFFRVAIGKDNPGTVYVTIDYRGKNIYITDEIKLNNRIYEMLQAFGLSREDYDTCIKTFAGNRIERSFSLQDYELNCTAQRGKRHLEFIRR